MNWEILWSGLRYCTSKSAYRTMALWSLLDEPFRHLLPLVHFGNGLFQQLVSTLTERHNHLALGNPFYPHSQFWGRSCEDDVTDLILVPEPSLLFPPRSSAW